MKIAISIPDEIFEEAERLEKVLGRSGSELFANAQEESFPQAKY